MEADDRHRVTGRSDNRLFKTLCLILGLSLTFLLQACQDRPDDATSLGVLLTSITVTPANPTLADPTTQQMTATGLYGNGTTADITNSVNWVSEYPAVATISDDPSDANNPKGQLKTVFTGSTTITARSGDIKASTTVTVTSPQLSRIEVTPAYTTFALVAVPWVQMKATGIYEDNTVADLTNYATWSSSNTSVATITNVSGNQGKATCIAAGTATITAAFKGASGTTDLILENTSALDATGTVGPRVTPFNPRLSVNSYQQFKATALLTNGTSQDVTDYAIWNSSSATQVAVSNSADDMGLGKTGASDATPIVSATLSGNTGPTITLDLDDDYYLYKLEINPEYPAIAQGVPYQLKAIGIFRYTPAAVSYYFTQDLTDQVTWSSSDASIATVSNSKGSQGLVSITSVPGAADRTITISAKSPLFTSLIGTTKLTIKSNSLKLTTITVSPSNPANHLHTKQQFKAYGTFSDGTNSFVQDITRSVIWSSADASIAVVSNEHQTAGKTVNRTDGQTTITATLNGISGSSTLTVKPASVTVTALNVTPASANAFVRVDTKLQMTATATFSDGGTQDVTENVMWESSNEAQAFVSNVEGEKGLVTGIGAGSPAIKAEWLGPGASPAANDSQSPTVSLINTLDSVTITQASSAEADGTIQLTATGYAAGGASAQDITESGIWSSSNPEVASVLNIPGKKGKVIRNGNGTTTVTFRLAEEDDPVNISDEHEFQVNQ